MGRAPQPFQIVEEALLLQEQVDDHIAVIHQHPATVGGPFDRERQLGITFLDGLAHIVRQRFQLAVTVAVTDDEEVGDDRVRAQIEQDDLFRLFVLDDIYDIASQFQSVQRSLPIG